jgi:hypothetical protein
VRAWVQAHIMAFFQLEHGSPALWIGQYHHQDGMPRVNRICVTRIFWFTEVPPD